MQVIFLGLPGAGKGTQSKLLADQCQIPHISAGFLIRQAIAEKTSLGLKAKNYFDLGHKMPDNFLVALIRERLIQPNAQKGWILDGLPRNAIQAYSLERFLQVHCQPLQQVFYLNVSINNLVTRLSRQMRTTANESIMRRLLETWEDELTPLINFYQRRNLLQVIDGNCEIADISILLRERIQSSVKSDTILISHEY